MEAELPACAGALVQRAIRRVMDRVPLDPDARRPGRCQGRRCARRDGELHRGDPDPDADRATVVIHAPLGAVSGASGGEVQDGPPVPPATLQRLLCTSRVETVVEDAAARVHHRSGLRRIAPAWMVRQVRYRDRGCTFPGCGTRAFTEAHHLRFWREWGPTTLENLALVCSFHHRHVHERGWRVARAHDGRLEWRTPRGVRWRAGPTAKAPAEPQLA